ncbi:hypothetical protein GGX14DRAFT_608771 [Mycena pura]|uniref:Uncharacterized protein n=1 Tax=Mycena pura TaxID=153505 RepID=A0AAD6Y367_9AGAR|nr:hypothetical protein GGX14DRAFT_608771 [Mycena pura]
MSSQTVSSSSLIVTGVSSATASGATLLPLSTTIPSNAGVSAQAPPDPTIQVYHIQCPEYFYVSSAGYCKRDIGKTVGTVVAVGVVSAWLGKHVFKSWFSPAQWYHVGAGFDNHNLKDESVTSNVEFLAGLLKRVRRTREVKKEAKNEIFDTVGATACPALQKSLLGFLLDVSCFGRSFKLRKVITRHRQYSPKPGSATPRGSATLEITWGLAINGYSAAVPSADKSPKSWQISGEFQPVFQNSGAQNTQILVLSKLSTFFWGQTELVEGYTDLRTRRFLVFSLCVLLFSYIKYCKLIEIQFTACGHQKVGLPPLLRVWQEDQTSTKGQKKPSIASPQLLSPALPVFKVLACVNFVASGVFSVPDYRKICLVLGHYLMVPLKKIVLWTRYQSNPEYNLDRSDRCASRFNTVRDTHFIFSSPRRCAGRPANRKKTVSKGKTVTGSHTASKPSSRRSAKQSAVQDDFFLVKRVAKAGPGLQPTCSGHILHTTRTRAGAGGDPLLPFSVRCMPRLRPRGGCSGSASTSAVNTAGVLAAGFWVWAEDWRPRDARVAVGAGAVATLRRRRRRHPAPYGRQRHQGRHDGLTRRAVGSSPVLLRAAPIPDGMVLPTGSVVTLVQRQQVYPDPHALDAFRFAWLRTGADAARVPEQLLHRSWAQEAVPGALLQVPLLYLIEDVGTLCDAHVHAVNAVPGTFVGRIRSAGHADGHEVHKNYLKTSFLLPFCVLALVTWGSLPKNAKNGPKMEKSRSQEWPALSNTIATSHTLSLRNPNHDSHACDLRDIMPDGSGLYYPACPVIESARSLCCNCPITVIHANSMSGKRGRMEGNAPAGELAAAKGCNELRLRRDYEREAQLQRGLRRGCRSRRWCGRGSRGSLLKCTVELSGGLPCEDLWVWGDSNRATCTEAVNPVRVSRRRGDDGGVGLRARRVGRSNLDDCERSGCLLLQLAGLAGSTYIKTPYTPNISLSAALNHAQIRQYPKRAKATIITQERVSSTNSHLLNSAHAEIWSTAANSENSASSAANIGNMSEYDHRRW